MSEPTRTEGQPHDRLTRICEQMTDAFDAHPELRDGDKCMVFISNSQQGGLELHGYDDDNEAMVDLLLHLRAIFAANGKTLDFMFVDEEGVDRL